MKKHIKIIIILTIVISTLLTIIFFIKTDYKIENIGNNNNKSEKILENNILNINSYEAKITLTVKSNKNENTYKIKQSFKENEFKQEVLEPESIKGTIIRYDGKDLYLENTILNISKIYENYKYISNNNLCLNSFAEEYKVNTDTSYAEKDNEIILEVNVKEDNKYVAKKILYIDKKTLKPTKMEIKDTAQNALVYILYNEVNVNNLREMT